MLTQWAAICRAAFDEAGGGEAGCETAWRTLIALFPDRVDEAAGVGLTPALQSARNEFEASIDPESIDALLKLEEGHAERCEMDIDSEYNTPGNHVCP